MTALVIQSHTNPLPHAWLQPCIDSVRSWAGQQGFTYRWYDDELLQFVPSRIHAKIGSQVVIATDLARLLALRQALSEGYDPVIWLDADYFIWAPQAFDLLPADHAVGREVWIQHEANGSLKTYRKVHNAFLMFRAGNSFLDFYIDTATRLLDRLDGPVPPQFIGPKLLTALHNICQFPVMESAGMFSPPVLKDLARGSGPALDQLLRHSSVAPAAANLCASLTSAEQIDENTMQQVMQRLTRQT